MPECHYTGHKKNIEPYYFHFQNVQMSKIYTFRNFQIRISVYRFSLKILLIIKL